MTSIGHHPQSECSLPRGWIAVPLADAVTILDSFREPVNRRTRAGRQGNIPYYGSTGLAGWIDDYIFDEEIVLLGEDAAPFLDKSKHVAYRVEGKCWVNNHAHVLRGKPGVVNRYLVHALNWVDYKPWVSGTTRLKLPQGEMKKIPLLLPPTAEQERIADRIDELFTDLAAGVAALERVKRNLSRYRAAVLHAAVTGRLTEAWRKEHGPPEESAPELLERILVERRKQWERRTLAAYDAKGKQPPKNWKSRYKEPAPPKAPEDGTTLPDLPEGWCWASADQLIWDSSYGTSMRCDYDAPGEPVLRIPNIAKGELDLTDIKSATAALDLELPTEYLQPGDMLVCRTNGSIRLIGKAAIVRDEFDLPTYYASYLIRLRAMDQAIAEHLHLAFTASHGRVFIEKYAASSAGQHNISMTTLQEMPIPLAPRHELEAVREAVNEKLSQIDALETEVTRGIARAGRLRQGILKAAFEGMLVPQDPNDEPASVLLERIREPTVDVPKFKRKTRKTGRAHA